MNECLNSDDEDEEDHTVLFSCFGYPHGGSCKVGGIPGFNREYFLFLPLHSFLNPQNTLKYGIFPPAFRYWKHSGLIT